MSGPRHPPQPVVMIDGVARFKANAIVEYLLGVARRNGFGLNELAGVGTFAPGKPFSREDWSQFAQLIGYSVSGYCDLSYGEDRVAGPALREAERLEKAGAK